MLAAALRPARVRLHLVELTVLPRNARIPLSFDLSQEGRVNNPMAERFDERHVCLSERAAWLDVDGHLSLVAAVALIDPAQVHHAVHCAIRHFRGKFDVGAVEGREWQ